MAKYNVTIEQPLCKTWTIEAENIDQAHDIAKEKYISCEWVLTGDDYGTDAQVQIESDDETESTEWTDL